MFYLKFIWIAITTNIKLSLAHRGAFLLTILITIVKQILFLVAWNFFFEKYKLVEGWNFNDMLLMFGIVCFASGIIETFAYGLRDLPKLIEVNQLDTFLLQPKNVILNIALSKGDIASLGEVFAGVLLIAYSGYLSTQFLDVILILSIATLFMFSLLLYLGSLAFFLQNAFDFIQELFLNAMIVATQPNVAYRGALKILTLTILPLAFISYFPVEYLRTGLAKHLWMVLLGTGLFFGLACWLFQRGLKRYESGNIISYRH